MRLKSHLLLVIVPILATLILGSSADAQRHGKHDHRRGGRRVVSAQEAREASFRKAQLRHKLHGLHSHMHQVRAKIHEAKVKENAISENIETVEARIARTRHRLARVNSRLALLATQHVQVVRRLDETQRRLAQRRYLLAQRVRDNYVRGQATYAQVLLASRSVHEMLSRGYYVRQIVQSDAQLIQGVQTDIRQIEADKRQLEAQAREQKALADEYEAQKQQYAADLARKQELLQGVQEVRQEAESELDDLEAEAEAMTDRIRTLSEMLQRRREAQRQAHAQRRRQEPGRQDSGRQDEAEEAPPVWHGGFIRPVAGPVTSGFGYRFHPILHRRKLHTGIDFGAGYGAPIHAAGGGTVIMAQYTRGYGNCVIVDHGNGVTTLYGHCSELLVSEGSVVSQGQVIARVGATGMATGPHLHFEVRHNGVPVSPF